MSRTERLIVVLGEGGATGVFIGAVLGGWEVWLNSDVEHGMFRLAAHRLGWPMAAAGALGMLASGTLALLLAGLARCGRKAAWAGIAGLGFLWVGGMAALAFPLREEVFPMHRFSGHVLTRAIFAVVAASCLLFLAWRSRAAVRGDGSAPGRLRVLRTVIAAAAVAFTTIGLVLRVLGPGSSRASGRPSIILVSIDTLRADRLGVLGNKRPLTPSLDGLAAGGTLFEQAMSASPWTLPSHASLFTSHLPFDLLRHWDYGSAIHARWTLLAERFYDAGYRTGAFTGGGYVSALMGFGQGFEVYEEHDEPREGGPEAIAAAALAWVRSLRGSPFFLFFHTYEPHYPYTHADFARPSDAGRLPPVVTYKEVDAIHRGGLVPTPAERRYVTDLYDGDVAHADAVVGGFLRALGEDGILDRSLLVVLSDHGEALWDREPDYSPDHGHSLYQELVHVPLIVRWPGRVGAGARIRTPVSLLDVAPTLLALAGLPGDPAHQGRSLGTTLLSGEEPEPRPILAECMEYGPDRFMMREGDMKAVLTPYPERFDNGVSIPVRPLEIFALAADPMERDDLSTHLTGPGAEMVELLWHRARRILEGPTADRQENPPLPEDLLEQLRSLGYLK